VVTGVVVDEVCPAYPLLGALLPEDVPSEVPAPTDAIVDGVYLLAGLAGNLGVSLPASVVADGSRFHDIFGIFQAPALQPVKPKLAAKPSMQTMRSWL